jgi:hypothetical protein
MSKRAYVIPVGLFSDRNGRPSPVAFLQHTDHVLPDYCGLIKPIGGAMNPGESEVETLVREMSEENPGWYSSARIPGTSKGCWGLKAEGGFSPLIVNDKVSVYLAFVDAGVVAHRLYVNSSKESSPITMNIRAVTRSSDSDWLFPELKTALLDSLNSIDSFISSR